MATAATHRTGIRIDRERFDYELGRRALRPRDFARRSGIPEPTVSEFRNGRPVTPTMLRRITSSLLELPLVPGTDLVIAEPEKKTVSASSIAETVQEVQSDAQPSVRTASSR